MKRYLCFIVAIVVMMSANVCFAEFVVTTIRNVNYILHVKDRSTLIDYTSESWDKVKDIEADNKYFLVIELKNDKTDIFVPSKWFFNTPKDVPMGEIYDPVNKINIIQYERNHGYMPIWRKG